VPSPLSAAESEVVASFVRAYQASDIDAVVALLTDEVFVSMPPMSFEYEGRAAARAIFTSILRDRSFTLVPTRANGQPAFGTYLLGADGARRGTGLMVVTLEGDRVSALTRFEAAVLPWFGLPRVL
jgi:RNA polymerase sigma-70 factor (ECF subfamily)